MSAEANTMNPQQQDKPRRPGNRALRRGARASVVALLLPQLALGQQVGQQMVQQAGQQSDTVAQLSTQDRQRTDAGTLAESQRRADAQPAVPRPAGKTVIRANTPKSNNSMAGVRMSVKGFRFEGNVGGVSPEAIDRVLAPWKDRELSFAEYEQAVHAVARFLRENGHPNAEVRVSRAQVRDNMIAVAIQGLTPGTFAAAPPDAADAARPVTDAQPRVFVREFRVSGSTAVSQESINQRVAAYTNRALTLKELDEATAAIAGAFRAQGLGLAQAFMPPQKIEDGVVAVTVQPGVVDGATGNGGIVVQSRGDIVKPSLIERVIAQRVKAGEPLSTPDLEQALRVAGDIPGIKSVKANLVPGSQPGTTQVQAQVEESRSVTGSAWVDNHGSRYTGVTRLSGQFNLNSPSGNGEQYNLALSTSTGMKSVKIGGSAMLTPSGARAGASYSRMTMDLGGALAPLNLNSDATVWSLFGTYPLLRSAQTNLSLDGTLDRRGFVNNLAGFRDNDRVLTVATAALTGDTLDRWRGQTAFNAQVTVGNVDLSRSPAYELVDSATANTQGGFGKLNVQAQRLGPLGDGVTRFSLFTSFSAQFSGKNLDSGEKFQLGGPSGVRAYPIGEGLGDRGWLASAEVRYAIPALGDWNPQAFAFLDAGGLRQYNTLWPAALPAGRPNEYTLAGAGFGVSFTRPDFGSLRVMYATKLGSNPNPTITNTDSDGQNKGGRIWIFGTISF